MKGNSGLPNNILIRLLPFNRQHASRELRDIGNCEEELPKKPVGRLSVVCWPTVGRLLADCRPSVGQLLAVCWPTVGRLSADRRPTGFPQNIDYQSADSRLTNDRQLADSW